MQTQLWPHVRGSCDGALGFVFFTTRQYLKAVQFIYVQEPRGSVGTNVHCVFHNFSSAAAADALVKQRHACPCTLEARVGGADQRECVGFRGGKEMKRKKKQKQNEHPGTTTST